MAATGDSHGNNVKSDFMAAEEIKGILHGREKTEQERIIRWVTESLSLAAPVVQATATSGHVQPTPPTASPIAQTGHHGTSTKKNIKAFVDEKKPKSAVHFVAVVAYFHHFEAAEKKETIVPDDIQEAARLSSWRRFPTPATPLNNAVTLGYLDRVGKSTFKINAVGENLVAMAMPGNAIEGGAARKTQKKAARQKPKKQVKK